jgi:cysteinyl-tRNA synthetase
MSKSLGNFITINELLQKWPGEVLRLNMLRTHYRQPIDWTEGGMEESADTLKTWFGRCEMNANPALGDTVSAALSDDLNTPKAITELHQLNGDELAGSLAALGFSGNLTDPRTSTVDEGKIDKLIVARKTARDEKNWAESDCIRDELDAMGVVLKDGADGTTWEVKR